MGKSTLELTTVEMFALKHALQSQVRYKQDKIKTLESTTLHDDNIDFYIRLKKDVEHEKELTDRLEAGIKRCSPRVRL
ncbi:hypothetical protein NBE98_09745 [Clostridium swellfunianum]|uniref:hypothetical protein n=1 Tax=Clostridium swellfunianum TaxID=1367462 RepID=UPI0020302BD9|nr:hypothetical protein [Clostridium swellfunianum]MCM0648656.1 hypothetical protein [Clostridium swellfunianum]